MESRTAIYNEQLSQTAINEAWTDRHPVATIALYSLLYLGIALGLASYFSAGAGLSQVNEKIIYLLLISLSGLAYMLTFPSKLDFMRVFNGRIGLLYILLALLTGLFSFFVFSLTDSPGIQLALASCGSFLLPYVIFQCWIHFDSIFISAVPLWMIPEMAIEKRVALIFLNSLQMRVLLKRHPADKIITSFPVTAPATMPVGKMFQQLIKDQEAAREALAIDTECNAAFGWRFIQKKPFYDRPLNAEATLRENKLNMQAVILIEKIQL